MLLVPPSYIHILVVGARRWVCFGVRYRDHIVVAVHGVPSPSCPVPLFSTSIIKQARLVFFDCTAERIAECQAPRHAPCAPAVNEDSERDRATLVKEETQ